MIFRRLFLASLPFAACVALAADWKPGARVLVEKGGSGQRAIVLKAEAGRVFVAYEGTDARFDEWVEIPRVRDARPVSPPPIEPEREDTVTTVVNGRAAPDEPEPLPDTLELPVQPADDRTVEVWLEQLARTEVTEPVRFSTAVLMAPNFTTSTAGEVATRREPSAAVALRDSLGKAGGFAAVEDGIVVYRSAPDGSFVIEQHLDMTVFGSYQVEHLAAADVNGDGRADLFAAGGPVAQLYYGMADGTFAAAPEHYLSKLPVRGLAVGRFFGGALPWGLAIIEGENAFRVLSIRSRGLGAAAEPYEVKFDRIVDIASGDFDGDGLADIAITTADGGVSTGAWMYFNQHGTHNRFLWPIGGRDNFARRLAVADLDRDGKDDLILTDGNADYGSRVRVVYGAGRAGWEDPWDLVGAEYGIGFGTAGIVTGDFNHDGRIDIGVAGRNGLRVHLGGDYRRIGRNPVWLQTAAGEAPKQRAFQAADFNGDDRVDLLAFTPFFASGFRVALNATPPAVAGLHVPAPLNRRPVQASSIATTIERPSGRDRDEELLLKHVGTRAEPYGPYRYRLMLEMAVNSRRVVAALDAVCKYHGEAGVIHQIAASTVRQGDEIWWVQVVVPRGMNYEFVLTARDDTGRATEPMRIRVIP